MIIIISKKKVKLIDSILKVYAEHPDRHAKEYKMMRAIWNIFTNNNNERKRSMYVLVEIFRKMLNKEKKK